MRRLSADLRRIEVARLLLAYDVGSPTGGLYSRGVQRRIARELDVSEATISRDMRVLHDGIKICARCGCASYGS